MRQALIWDLPTRLFHWLFAATFAGAFGIAVLLDDDSPTFGLHMVLGLIMVFMVAVRVVWGVAGSRYARFRSFVFGPGAVLEYLRGTVTGGGKKHVGHNPGSSVAIFAMLLLAVGLAVTGVLRGRGVSAAKELHEVLAYGFMAVVVAHVAGVLWHTIRHRENLTMSMIDGKKDVDAGAGIASSHPVVAMAFVALVGVWSWRVAAGYDRAKGVLTIPVIGQTIPLGESEGGKAHKGSSEAHHDAREHDDD